MKKRDIKNGQFGWYEKGAMEKIESLPFKQQASCKLIYIAICSMSARNKNGVEISCYKFDIARYSSVSEKTVQRYLKDLESLGIIKQEDQGRTKNGKYEKLEIKLISNTLPAGHMVDSSEKVGGKLGDTESDIRKEKKEKKEKKESNKKYIKKFISPSLEEIKEFMKEKEITSFTAERFFFNYEENEWMVGSKKMKSWKMAIHKWKHDPRNNSGSGSPISKQDRKTYLESLTFKDREKIMEAQHKLKKENITLEEAEKYLKTKTK